MIDPKRWRDAEGDAPDGAADLLRGAPRPKRMPAAARARSAARVARLAAFPTGASLALLWTKALLAGASLGLATVIVYRAAVPAPGPAEGPAPARAEVSATHRRAAMRDARTNVANAPDEVTAAAPDLAPASPPAALAEDVAAAALGDHVEGAGQAEVREARKEPAPVPAMLRPAVLRPAMLRPAALAPAIARTPAPAAVPALSAPPSQPLSLAPTAKETTAAPSASASAMPQDALLREATLLEHARTLLASRPDEALSEVEAHARAFRGGQLIAERELIAIDALCRLGRVGEARARGEALVHRFPQSVYETRVERLLANASSGP